jgi:protocatechuate 3,4-dioxygenase beta subunit
MDNDDLPVGSVLTRREVLALFGTVGAGLLAGCVPGGATASPEATSTPTSGADLGPTTASATSAAAVPSCVVRPAMSEGPYFVDEMLNRSDIRSDPTDGTQVDGTPLELTFAVSRVAANGCVALADAMVDVWHCDALGVYSDVEDPGFNTAGKKFLRGYQLADSNGVARFVTIYPGWYQGRTVHIHFKIRGQDESGTRYEFTSQLFFDDALTDQVYAGMPYAGRGERTLRNDGDRIYLDGGSQMTLQPTETAEGYTAVFDIGLQLG